MSHYLGSLTVLLLSVACSGNTTGDAETGGGTAQGGSSTGGTGSAGKSTGGSISSGGKIGNGGSVNNGGSVSSGGTTFDPRCPATTPSGMCEAEDDGLTCQYNEFNGCLCYLNAASFAPCQQVDPTCPSAGGTAGAGGTDTAGAGGAAGGDEAGGSGGAGGFAAKIAAPPPRNLCSCSAATWVCSQSFL